MPPVSESTDFYSGSRLLTPVAGVIGLSIDQVNFLACELVALGLGFPFRSVLGPKTTSSTVRHIVELLLGIALVLFCFGSQIVHLFLLSILTYVMMLTIKHKLMPVMVMSVAMLYLAVAHIYRMVLDYGGYTLDITGPLMIAVQKVSIVAFAYHDGTQRDEKTLTPIQKKYAIKALPDWLSYFSYIFCFHGVMCGPLAFYTDYIAFIDGTCYNKAKGDSSEPSTDIPSPTEVMGKKLVIVAILGALMMMEPMVAPWQNLKDETFLAQSSWLYLMLYLLASMSMHRPMYYFAWKLGEVVNNSSGLGFRGYDEDGKANWSLLNNVEIYSLEVSNSLKVNIESWNVLTAVWLRYTVYERVRPSIGTWAVFTISAFWHGFYPGYYIAFLTGALFTTAARLIRRNVRPFFQQSESHKQVYDFITFLFTRFANSIMVVTFVTLDVRSSLTVFNSILWCLHIPAVLVIVYFNFIHPIVRPKPKQKSEKKE